MNQDERIWLSQQIMFHKDNEYGSQTSFELSYSANTTDFQSYGVPHLNISLSSMNPVYIKKMIPLNYQNAGDFLTGLKHLFDSFQKGFPQQRGTFEFTRRYHKDKLIKLDFFVYGNGDKVCSISIHNSQTDFLSIVMSFELFKCLCSVVKDFVANYFKIVSNILSLSQNYLLLKILQKEDTTNNVLMSITKAGFGVNSQLLHEEKEEVSSELLEATEKINELDTFLGPNMENIIVPEIVQTPVTIEKSKTDHSGGLVTNVLKKNLKILEDLLTSSFTALDPIEAVQQRLLKDLDYSNDFSFLPGITENENKSYRFLTKLLYLNKLHQFSIGKQGVPELKLLVYNPRDVDPRNLAIAYDLFVIFIYLRLFIAKMSKREPNVYKNKIVFYTAFRYVFDMLCISFIHATDINKVKSCVLERFETYSKEGFFNEYSKILDTVSIPPIVGKEFSDLADQILVKLSSSPLKSIEELHNELYEKGKEIENIDLRIPFTNNLNLEQILKVSQIQLTFALGQFDDVKNDKIKLAEKINSVSGIDADLLQEVVSLFCDKKLEMEKKLKEKESNLVRACKFYISEIPTGLQEQFLQYVTNISSEMEKFDLNKFPLEEFKDNIIKTIYVWNENDSKILYSDFMSKVENCMMSKDLIIVKNKMIDDNQEPQDTNYDFGTY